MTRPKTLKKPSKARLERKKRRRGAKTSLSATFSNAAVSLTNFTTYLPSQRLVLRERQVTIESLDEGVTWHDRETMRPAANISGRLVMTTQDWGLAPETMRPGSGVYSFEVTFRGATDEEARAWLEEHNWVASAHSQIERAREDEAAEIARAEYAFRQLEEVERSERAAARAEMLLRSHLSKAQFEDLERHGGFWVTSQFGNLYWVTRNAAVRFDEGGRAIQRYCIHAVDHRIPRADNALLRKLLLECNEELFLRTANPSQPWRSDVEPEVLRWNPQSYVYAEPPQRLHANAVAPVANGLVVEGRAETDGSGGVVVLNSTSATTVNVSGAAYTGADGFRVPVAPILYWVNGVVRALSG